MSVYNTKVIKYPNGTVQIRKYSKFILSKSPSNPYEKHTLFDELRIDKLNSEKEKLLHEGCIENGYIEVNGKNYTISPFDGCIVEEYAEKTINKNDDNLWSSLNRTKNKIHNYSRCAEWEYFITFTLNSEYVNRYDYTECSRIVRRWINNQRNNAPDLLYLLVPEQHKDGAWHFHGLFANVGNMKFTDSGREDKKGRPIYNLSRFKYGFTTAEMVDDIHKVSGYITKYITKELCERTKGKQRYFVSKNMPEPEVSTLLLLDDECMNDDKENFLEFMNTICDSLGMEVVYTSFPRHDGAFVDVDYYELQERK